MNSTNVSAMLSWRLLLVHYLPLVLRQRFFYFVVVTLLMLHWATTFEQQEYPDFYYATLGVTGDSVAVATPKGKLLLPDSLVLRALELQQTPYKWAGRTPSGGFDCSGFINYLYGSFGIELPRSSRHQYLMGIPVQETDATCGDLIFFTSPRSGSRVGHVGMVISGHGMPIAFIHSSTGRGVVIDSLQNNYRRRFVGIKRLERIQ